ncbi:MAG: hypothetical protein RMJ36_02070 [Candidatus Calescibacterium sp.]|nr:hypothetical protein [Candidatus Calescibacterium sp.]MDW8132425.1 hypothetical protein [Candidatus Calescibacterium sp.]
MEKLLKLSIILLILTTSFLGCNKKINTNQESLSFKNLEYYINEETYFSIKQGIYKNNHILFKDMKIVFKEGYTEIKEGYLDLNSLIVKPEKSLEIYTNDFIIDIQKDPIINLKKMQIEGYDTIIKNLKKEDKINKSYKINIDIRNNKIYTYQNTGVW